MIPSSVSQIVQRLEGHNKFVEDSQSVLREFVTNTEHPLDERFEVWSKWCAKNDDFYIINAKEHPITGAMVDALWPGEYDRYKDYDWSCFLNWVEDSWWEGKDGEFEEEAFEIDGQKVTVEMLKESLIQTNFGSFNYDW